MTNKCFGCFVDAKFVLPCYHGLCDICLNDVLTSEELVCHCYPEDGDVKCASRFEKEDVRDLSVPIDSTKCVEHNEEITSICGCEYLYCDRCVQSCECNDFCSIEEVKGLISERMNDVKSELTNKIKGLKCLTEMIQKYKYKEIESLNKQFELISDTFLVDIGHIENFVQFVDELPISQLIKTGKQIILTSETNSIPVDILDPIKDKNSDLDNVIKIMEIIIFNCKGNIHGYHDQALVYASDKGNLDVVELLLNYDADVNACDDSALRWASSNGHMAVVELLIKHGANIDAKNDYALRHAAMNGHKDVVKCLLSHGAVQLK
jgi:hypothetical protein